MLNKTKFGAAVLEIKSLEDKGEFSGYASTFGGEPDSVGDVIAPGAYTESLAEHKSNNTMPKMFWQHDSRKPIGKWLEMKEDEKGLFVRGRLNMGVQQAREAYELLKAEDIDGLSIGYRIVEYKVDTETEIWTLEKLNLREVSIVSIGANENATVESVKSDRRLHNLKEKIAAGDRLQIRELEQLLKGSLGLSNSQAERAVRVHFKGQGEPAVEDQTLKFLQYMAE